MENLTKITHLVTTITGKKKVKPWETFKCHKKDCTAILRIHWGKFGIVKEEVLDAKALTAPTPVKNVLETVIPEVIQTPIEKARELYEEKVGNKVPNNKKNDLTWITNKINSL